MSIPFDPPRPRPSGGGGGAAGFTPVLMRGDFTSELQVGNNVQIDPDVVTQEGITAGNGADGVAYGWSQPNGSDSSMFKVSEEMAGIYSVSFSVAIARYGTAGGLRNASWEGLLVNTFLLGDEGGNLKIINVTRAANYIDVNSDDVTRLSGTYVARLKPEMRFQMKWPPGFTLKGNSNGGQMSIVKISS